MNVVHWSGLCTRCPLGPSHEPSSHEPSMGVLSRMRLIALLLTVLVMAPPVWAQQATPGSPAEDGQAPLPVSLDKIKEALQQPPSLFSLRIDERLEVVDRVAVDPLPLQGEESRHASEDVGGQVRYVNPGHDQVASVVGEEANVGPSSLRRPADEPVARPEVPRRRPPGRRGRRAPRARRPRRRRRAATSRSSTNSISKSRTPTTKGPWTWPNASWSPPSRP